MCYIEMAYVDDYQMGSALWMFYLGMHIAGFIQTVLKNNVSPTLALGDLVQFGLLGL